LTLFLPLPLRSSPPRLNELPSEQLECARRESTAEPARPADLPWAAAAEMPPAPMAGGRFLATKLRSLQEN
jgi:hypothetical protein